MHGTAYATVRYTQRKVLLSESYYKYGNGYVTGVTLLHSIRIQSSKPPRRIPDSSPTPVVEGAPGDAFPHAVSKFVLVRIHTEVDGPSSLRGGLSALCD